jgi:hypothetical protein
MCGGLASRQPVSAGAGVVWSGAGDDQYLSGLAGPQDLLAI